MSRYVSLLVLMMTASVLVAFGLASGCTEECNRADDCASGEVCYKGACKALSASYVRCDSNRDCDESGRFTCRAGRCVLQGTVIADSGVFADAASGDGANLDALPSDATPDGAVDGATDAAATDAPAADATPADAASTDAQSDAGGAG